MKLMRCFREKSAIVASYLPWLLIALAVLAIVMVIIFMLRSEGSSLIEKAGNMFKFGLVYFSTDKSFYKKIN